MTHKTLFLASLSLPSARQLAQVARRRRWRVAPLDEGPATRASGPRTYYGGSDRAAEYSQTFQLALLEPPLDLLARVPGEFVLREVRFGTLADVAKVSTPAFIKPADPCHKVFDAGTYRSLDHLLNGRAISLQTPVLMSEPVEWTNEYRCFVCEGHAVAWSPYLCYGHPIWKPGCAAPLPPNLNPYIQRLHAAMLGLLPPAFVVDIGILEDGRWAIVEFNPAWCSGILGANVSQVLHAVERSAQWKKDLRQGEEKWLRGFDGQAR